MRDLYFYPLALIVIAAIVAFAVLPGLNRAAENQQNILTNGFVLTGDDLQKLTAAPTTFVEFKTDLNGAVTNARIFGNMPRDMAPASAGVFGTLSSGYLKAFAGKSLEIRVRARKSANSSLDQFDFGFFTPGAGASGWKKFTLADTFKDIDYTYDAPVSLAENQVSYVGIWPGDKGNSQAMDVEYLSVKIAQP
ncbi:MAG: hypothetical protein HKO02_13725 [Hyphomonadaceae bacterium]|nr:hypothetical protein [Hyphomonadaceae bacterium]